MINLSGRSDPGTCVCVCVCVCVCGRCWWTYSGAAAAAVLSCNKFIMLWGERDQMVTPSRESERKWQLPGCALSSDSRNKVCVCVCVCVCGCVETVKQSSTSRMDLVKIAVSFHILLCPAWVQSRHTSMDSFLSGRSGESCQTGCQRTHLLPGDCLSHLLFLCLPLSFQVAGWAVELWTLLPHVASSAAALPSAA